MPLGQAAPRQAFNPVGGRRLLSRRHVPAGPGPRPAVTVNHLFERSTCFPNLCLENSHFHIFKVYVLTAPGTGSWAPGSLRGTRCPRLPAGGGGGGQWPRGGGGGRVSPAAALAASCLSTGKLQRPPHCRVNKNKASQTLVYKLL